MGRRGREDRKREAHRVPRWVVADLPSPPGESGKRLALTRYGLIEVVKSPLIGISPLIVLVTLSGCDTEQAQRPTYDPDTQVVITKSEYAGLKKVGRFQPFRDVTGVALDTSTGQLCKTHDWRASSEPLCPKHGTTTGPCLMGRSPYEDAPLCSSLP